jgi:hypothetical protein
VREDSHVCVLAQGTEPIHGFSGTTAPSLRIRTVGKENMSESCFRSSPHHGRRANGALVMMVLSKGIEESISTHDDSASSSVEVEGSAGR